MQISYGVDPDGRNFIIKRYEALNERAELLNYLAECRTGRILKSSLGAQLYPKSLPYFVQARPGDTYLETIWLILGKDQGVDLFVEQATDDLVRALLSMHESGVTHNDIKRENIALCSKRAQLFDFGSSRVWLRDVEMGDFEAAKQFDIVSLARVLGTPEDSLREKIDRGLVDFPTVHVGSRGPARDEYDNHVENHRAQLQILPQPTQSDRTVGSYLPFWNRLLSVIARNERVPILVAESLLLGLYMLIVVILIILLGVIV